MATTTTTRRTRIVLVEDHALVRSGFKALLDEQQPDLEVTDEAADGAAGVEIALERHDDVVPMDLRMPVLDGIEATRRLLGVDSRPQAVVLADESGRPGHTGDDPL